MVLWHFPWFADALENTTPGPGHGLQANEDMFKEVMQHKRVFGPGMNRVTYPYSEYLVLLMVEIQKDDTQGYPGSCCDACGDGSIYGRPYVVRTMAWNRSWKFSVTQLKTLGEPLFHPASESMSSSCDGEI
jgi:hypothetical protein